MSRISSTHALHLMILAYLSVVTAAPAAAANSRLMLAMQYNWAGNKGFYIDLENTAGDYGAVQPLSSLIIAMGVADGKQWRYVVKSPTWRYDHHYHAKAEIDVDTATLSLDGDVLGSAAGAFANDATDRFYANQIPNWACAQTQYWLAEERIKITSGDQVLLDHAFPADQDQITGNISTTRAQLADSPLLIKPSEPLTIDVDFVIRDRASLTPIVDAYGQWNFGDWPGKIKQDTDLKAAAAAERKTLASMSEPIGLDPYGGSLRAGWKQPATGYFAIVRRNGYWWMLSPNGNPLFYTGMDNPDDSTDNGTLAAGRERLFAWLPPRDGPYAAAYGPGLVHDAGPTDYFSFPTANFIRKFGSHWPTALQDFQRLRMRKWAFRGKGKWSTPGDTPYIAVLRYDNVTAIADGKPDVFDPATLAALRASLRPQIVPHLKDPYLVGWSVGNEYGEIVQYSTCAAALLTTQSPAKKAVVDYVLTQTYKRNLSAMTAAWKVTASSPENLYQQPLAAPAAEQEGIREFYEDNYYRVLYESVKSIDPNHLYLGDWVVPNWWINASDWTLVAAHCDVVGYDDYHLKFGDSNVPALAARVDKPILCGEFGFPATYLGERGFAQWDTYVDTNADAGAAYRGWIGDAANNPNCIGACWFEYRDQPITGRGGGIGGNLVYGENMAFGTLDVTDQPKWDLLKPMIQANRAVTSIRLQATARGHMRR